MKGNKDLTSKIVTQVDRLQDHHLQNADIIVIQYKMPLKFPGKKRVGFLELWEGKIIPDMIKVNESNIASIMIDTGTIMWEVDHQAHLERVQIEGEKNGKIRESLLQIEYSRPNAEARAIYSFPRSSGKNLVSINHLGAKYGVGLVEQRRGGKSEKVMKNDVVIGESWSGFTKLGQVVDVVVRTRVEQKCVRCQMWFPMAPNNTSGT